MLFDRYIMIDWSSTDGLSSVAPKKDAVWMAVAAASGAITETYFRSRSACVDATLQELKNSDGQRVLVGFDFPYGYPHGLARALGLGGVKPPWRLVWDELTAPVNEPRSIRIEDDATNKNNRFRVAAKLNEVLSRPGMAYGPFWGRPSKPEIVGLSENCPYETPFETKSGVRLGARRITELSLPKSQSAWKLFTAGSVGGQVLVGLPCVARLRDALPECSKVWPFETGFTNSPTDATTTVVHAEIWPGVIDGLFPLLAASRERDGLRSRLKKKKQTLSPADASSIRERLIHLDAKLGSLITDQLQVRLMCEWARAEDGNGALARRFATPPGLTDDQVATCVAEEGWILGAH